MRGMGGMVNKRRKEGKRKREEGRSGREREKESEREKEDETYLERNALCGHRFEESIAGRCLVQQMHTAYVGFGALSLTIYTRGVL